MRADETLGGYIFMSEEKSNATFGSLISKFFSGIGSIIIILVALFVIFGLIRPDPFLTYNNLYNLARAAAINGIAALGMTVVIIAGGIDLSAGSVIGASTMLVAYFISGQITGIPGVGLTSVPVAMLIAIAFSLIVGLINGILVNDGELPPFIATIGTQILIRNFILMVTQARIVAELPQDTFLFIADLSILGIPLMAFIWFALAILTWLMIKFTPFGRYVFAVGSNPATARLSGISLRQTRYGAYLYSGLMFAIAGILLCARLGNGIPSTGVGYEFDAIASSVVGGASLSGGEGSVAGTFIGSIVLQTIRNGGIIIGINAFVLEIIVGAVMIFAVLLDKKSGKKLV